MANESSYLAARLGLSARRVCHAGEAHCRAGIEQPYLHPAVAPILDQRTGHCSLPLRGRFGRAPLAARALHTATPAAQGKPDDSRPFPAMLSALTTTVSLDQWAYAQLAPLHCPDGDLCPRSHARIQPRIASHASVLAGQICPMRPAPTRPTRTLSAGVAVPLMCSCAGPGVCPRSRRRPAPH